MMDKRDFEIVAQALNWAKPTHEDFPGIVTARFYWALAVTHIANELEREYPNFNKERFLWIAGVDFK